MNFWKKILNSVTICCLSILLFFLSCSKSDDEPVVTPPREFVVQYGYDKDVIEKYLNNYTYTINANNDITFSVHNSETSANPKLISLLNATTFPKLLSKDVALHNITYKVYYLVFNEGNTSRKPSRVDEVFTAYRGFYLENQNGVLGLDIEFENNPLPNSLFSLTSVIRGWTEIFPLFGTGTIDTSAPENGPTVYQNYGVGAIFIPSGLGYFNIGTTSIPSYSPLVFTFKLYDLKRADQDADGVLSIDENLNGNDNFIDDDTDSDGVPNFVDIDDDNDGYITKTEIQKPDGTYYSFTDIPFCSSGTIKKHLDKNCH